MILAAQFRQLSILSPTFKAFSSLKILAIETSCDDTAVAIVDASKKIWGEVTMHQHAVHSKFQGIVPHLASQAHKSNLPIAIDRALDESKLSMTDIDAIAATRGPGIAGSLSVGFHTAHAIAAACRLPFFAVNHMEAHALMPRFYHRVEFPHLCLLISGGHTMLVHMRSLGNYKIIGSTLDDSVGEAIDKAARIIRCEYSPDSSPASQFVAAAKESKYAVQFHDRLVGIPSSSKLHHSLDFSFSGLKESFKRLCNAQTEEFIANKKSDLAAAFMDACVDQLCNRVVRAVAIMESMNEAPSTITISGGVARNEYIFLALQEKLKAQTGLKIYRPEKSHHCVDNAAMIAWTALEYLAQNMTLPSWKNVDPDWSMSSSTASTFAA